MSSYELRSALKAAGKTSTAFYLGSLSGRLAVGEEVCNQLCRLSAPEQGGELNPREDLGTWEGTLSGLILPQLSPALQGSRSQQSLHFCWTLLTEQGCICAGLDPETKHFRVPLHSRVGGTVSKRFAMKSSQYVCIASQVIFIKPPSFVENPPKLKEAEWSHIHQKVHGLETAVTAAFLVQSSLFIASRKNFVVRSLSGWMCAIEYPPINWFARLVSRDLQIPPWPKRVLTFPLCVCVFGKDTNSTTTCCNWLSSDMLMNSSRLNLMIFWTA